MKKTDIDIDFADREKILKLIDCVPAMQIKDNEVRKHNSGIYVTAIPYDPINDCASIDYKSAEERGYFKLDFLNVNVYKLIKDEEHYQKILEQEPPWERLKEKEFVEKIIHISNHYNLIKNMEVNSITRMAMFLAVIRPGKRHLLGQKWGKIADDIWSIPDDESYYFKKSHSISYAVLVALHMNLINEKESLST